MAPRLTLAALGLLTAFAGASAQTIQTGPAGSGGGGGSGTVTSVAVTTANGVSGTVANPSTTPAISLTLGAITPVSVNGLTVTSTTGTFTLAAGKTLTASNTLTLTATDGSTLAIGAGGTLGSMAYYSTQTAATTLLGSTSLTGDVLTASAPVLNLTQQWNSVGTTFTGLKFNVDTTTYNQSAAASLLMDLQVGTVSKFKVDKAGNAYVGNPAGGFSNTGIMAVGAVFGTGTGNPSLVAGEQALFYASGVKVGEYVFGSWFKNNSTFTFQWSSTGATTGATDLTIGRNGPANLRFGAADAASPVAQTLSVQSVVAGTSNTAGQNFTINGSQSTGSGIGGSIIFQTAAANSGGGATVQNTLATAMVIDSVKTVRLGTGYTVATLPAAGTAGRRTYVTDALAPVYLGTLTGGGAVVCPVFDNGTAWVPA